MLKYWTLSSLNGRCSKAVFIKYCFSFSLRDIVHVEKKKLFALCFSKKSYEKSNWFSPPKAEFFENS